MLIRPSISAESPGNSFAFWHKYASLSFSKGNEWPSQINCIVEPICIALGGFATAGFNINYFDASGFRALASTLDILRGWMEIVRQSYQVLDNGNQRFLPVGLKTEELQQWSDRFGAAFGGKLSAATIRDIAHGYRKLSLTSKLPQPHQDAWVFQPRTTERALHPKDGNFAPKSKTYKPVMLKVDCGKILQPSRPHHQQSTASCINFPAPALSSPSSH